MTQSGAFNELFPLLEVFRFEDHRHAPCGGRVRIDDLETAEVASRLTKP